MSFRGPEAKYKEVGDLGQQPKSLCQLNVKLCGVRVYRMSDPVDLSPSIEPAEASGASLMPPRLADLSVKRDTPAFRSGRTAEL